MATLMSKTTATVLGGLTATAIAIAGYSTLNQPQPVPVTTKPAITETATPKHVRQGYERTLFMPSGWPTRDGEQCNTRIETLRQQSTTPVTIENCKITAGTWQSPYDNVTHTNPADVQIDHIVPLANAWDSGAWQQNETTREALAVDPLNLIAVTGTVNMAKSDKGPDEWMPEHWRCEYIDRWVAVKRKYKLTFDDKELTVIKTELAKCD